MSKFRVHLLGTVAGLAIAGTASLAAATPAFTIYPDAIPGITGYTSQTETDFNGTSDALIQQTGATTQTETGWVQGGSFTNNGAGSNFTTTGLLTEPGVANTYNLYITFTATVTGITGFGAGQTGSIAPGGFTYTVFADIGDNDTFTAGTTGPTGGTSPTVTDVGSNDVVVAVGTDLSGSAGFQASTGAPTFDTVSDLILCDGTTGQGKLGGKTVAAAGCGTFDALLYFTSPSPFYDLDFDSNTAGSVSDLTTDPTGTPANATLNGIVVDINFANIPEPSSLLLFGSAMLGLGVVARRRRKLGS